MLTNIKVFFSFLILYFASIYIFYRTPVYFGQLFFGFLLVRFYFSKFTLNWYFYFLLLFNSPGYLFSTADSTYRPIYYLHPVFNLPFLVFLVFSIKHYNLSTKLKIPHFQILYFSFAIFLIFVSLFFDFELDNLFVSLIGVLQISFIWVLPNFFSHIEKIKSFLFLFLFSSVPILLAQLFYISSGIHLIEFFGGAVYNSNFSNYIEIAEGSGRPLYSMQISCINLISYLFISVFDKEFSLKSIEKTILSVFAILSFLCLFVSATRGYIFFGLILIIGVFFKEKKNI